MVDVNYTHLTRHSYLSMMLKPYWALRAVRVVKNDGHTGLGDASLPAFVDEILLVCCTHRRHVGNPEHKAYRVEDVGLA